MLYYTILYYAMLYCIEVGVESLERLLIRVYWTFVLWRKASTGSWWRPYFSRPVVHFLLSSAKSEQISNWKSNKIQKEKNFPVNSGHLMGRDAAVELNYADRRTVQMTTGAAWSIVAADKYVKIQIMPTSSTNQCMLNGQFSLPPPPWWYMILGSLFCLCLLILIGRAAHWGWSWRRRALWWRRRAGAEIGPAPARPPAIPGRDCPWGLDPAGASRCALWSGRLCWALGEIAARMCPKRGG